MRNENFAGLSLPKGHGDKGKFEAGGRPIHGFCECVGVKMQPAVPFFRSSRAWAYMDGKLAPPVCILIMALDICTSLPPVAIIAFRRSAISF
jgi:hypothetical protein